jgi:hypothetical protein
VSTYFSHRIIRLFSRVGSRAIIASATGICLSMFAANASAQATRPYQMSILGSTDGTTNAGVDVPVFFRGQYAYNLQPDGRSIVWLPPHADLDVHDANDYDLIDWSRIVAVYVDEPYGTILEGLGTCPQPTTQTGIAFANRQAELGALAEDVRKHAPTARFWVNFTRHEIDLILDENSGCDLNKSYIDVISMDIYDVDFYTTLSNRYDDLYANHRPTPYQQLALVAGTFTHGYNQQTGQQGAARLSGYFAYAADMNQQCDLPLGPSRISGIYDRCPVWMVAGWMGGETPVDHDPRDYYPIDHANSVEVFNAWQAAFAVPRIDPSKARAMRDLIPLLRND